MLRSRFLIIFYFLTLLPLVGRGSAQTGAEAPAIQDNSFLVEEAYNQEFGVVQHISAVSHTWDAKDWIYTLTQEWPVPGVRHQLSYTLAYQHSGAYPGSGMGFGDVLLNYRYQLVGDGDARLAVAPRLSLICPTGSTTSGRGMGSFGVQTNLPASIVLLPKLVSHWNLGGTIVPSAQDAAGNHAFASGWNLGQSFIYLAHPRFNLMLETVYSGAQSVTSKDHTAWTRSLFLNPGVRWAYNFKNGLQIVPGIGVPVGFGPSAGEKGLFLYLSFEHPFRKLSGK